MHSNFTWEGSVEYQKIYKSFLVFWLAVMSMAWYLTVVYHLNTTYDALKLISENTQPIVLRTLSLLKEYDLHHVEYSITTDSLIYLIYTSQLLLFTTSTQNVGDDCMTTTKSLRDCYSHRMVKKKLPDQNFLQDISKIQVCSLALSKCVL